MIVKTTGKEPKVLIKDLSYLELKHPTELYLLDMFEQQELDISKDLLLAQEQGLITISKALQPDKYIAFMQDTCLFTYDAYNKATINAIYAKSSDAFKISINGRQTVCRKLCKLKQPLSLAVGDQLIIKSDRPIQAQIYITEYV